MSAINAKVTYSNSLGPAVLTKESLIESFELFANLSFQGKPLFTDNEQPFKYQTYTLAYKVTAKLPEKKGRAWFKDES